jgi:hypothetical protein
MDGAVTNVTPRDTAVTVPAVTVTRVTPPLRVSRCHAAQPRESDRPALSASRRAREGGQAPRWPRHHPEGQGCTWNLKPVCGQP